MILWIVLKIMVWIKFLHVFRITRSIIYQRFALGRSRVLFSQLCYCENVIMPERTGMPGYYTVVFVNAENQEAIRSVQDLLQIKKPFPVEIPGQDFCNRKLYFF